MSARVANILIFIVLSAMCTSSAFSGYFGGKHIADQWYAKHWVPLQEVRGLENSTFWQEAPKGTCLNGEGKWMNCTRPITIESPSDDVTVIGHGITVVNGSHVIVIQCNDETNGTVVTLQNTQTFMCRGMWKVKQ